MKRRATLLGLSLLLACASGCASSRPVTRLTFVTVDPGVVDVEILATDVERSWCYTLTFLDYVSRLPWKQSLVPDYGYAVALALKAVPGSDVMTDVEVQRRRSEYLLFRRVCSYVKGNVGRIR